MVMQVPKSPKDFFFYQLLGQGWVLAGQIYHLSNLYEMIIVFTRVIFRNNIKSEQYFFEGLITLRKLYLVGGKTRSIPAFFLGRVYPLIRG
jgi:hypothetical protein